MPNETFKGNLSKLGYIEIKELIKLLTAYNNGKITDLAKNYIGNGLNFDFNPYSGSVYLIDDDYKCFMLNNDLLDLWINTPNGYEGFIDDLINNQLENIILNNDKEDIEYLGDMLQHTKDNLLIDKYNISLLKNKLDDYILYYSI